MYDSSVELATEPYSDAEYNAKELSESVHRLTGLMRERDQLQARLAVVVDEINNWRAAIQQTYRQISTKVMSDVEEVRRFS